MAAKTTMIVLFLTPLLALAGEDVVTPGSPIPIDWANITALGAVIMGLLFLVIYYIPQSQQRQVDFASQSQQRQTDLAASMTKTHGETMKLVTDAFVGHEEGSRASFLATLDKISEREETRVRIHHDDHDKMAEALKSLAVQCAQARGIKVQ